jgi:methionyl-tRNA formyltransferase
MSKKVLVITDNQPLLARFEKIATCLKADGVIFDYRYSANNKEIQKTDDFLPVDVKDDLGYILSNYDLVISLHCRQFFPAELVSKVRCVNIHPGYNPYNRGWYPQVFSIINKKPVGVTIHEMDSLLDHGPIIVREEVPLYAWDTSQTAYERIIEKEIELLEKYLARIINADYHAERPSIEGNVNTKKDYESLCKLDPEEVGTFGSFIDRLRALTHGGYRNGYFDDEQGRRIYVSITLEPASGDMAK